MHPLRHILIDCDGVLLDWVSKFDQWMAQRGYQQRPNAKDYYRVHERFEDLNYTASKKFTRIFNESAAIGFLAPLGDSVYWVKKLNWAMGYRFTVVTSLSLDSDAQQLRCLNLRNLYGDIFDRVICLDTGSDKDQALAEFAGTGCWWIEDKPENALAGARAGLRSILLSHDHNRDFDHADVARADSWQDIYQLIAQSS